AERLSAPVYRRIVCYRKNRTGNAMAGVEPGRGDGCRLEFSSGSASRAFDTGREMVPATSITDKSCCGSSAVPSILGMIRASKFSLNNSPIFGRTYENRIRNEAKQCCLD